MYIDAWLWQILVTGCEVGIFLFIQTMPAIKLILSKCLCQIKSAHRGDEGGVINEEIMVFQEQDFFIIVQMLLKTCHEILVLEVLEILVVGKGLVVFSKGLVVFITSSNCHW